MALSEEDQVRFALLTRKLTEPGFSFEKLYASVTIIHEKLKQGEALTLEQQREYLAGCGCLRDIRRLGPFLVNNKIEGTSITATHIKQCHDFLSPFELSKEEKPGMRFFETNKAASYPFTALVQEFSNILEQQTPQYKPR